MTDLPDLTTSPQDKGEDDAALLETLREALSARHPATREVAQWFAFGHLQGSVRTTSAAVCGLAVGMLLTTEDSPELTVGLRKLLEAKDCFVRATIGSVF